MKILKLLPGVLLCGAMLFHAPVQADLLQDANKSYKKGAYAQALAKVEQILAEKPKDAPARFLKGVILTEQGKTDDAIQLFTALNEDFPELPEPYNNLAVLYASQGKYEKAKNALELAIQAHPTYVTAHENLGDIYAKLASQSYDRALQLDPRNPATKGKLSAIRDLLQDNGRKSNADKPVLTAAQSGSGAARQPAPVEDAVPATIMEVNAVVAPPSAPASGVASAPVSTDADAASAVVAASAVAANPADAEKAAQKARVADVMSSVNGWVHAWENKQVKKYLAYYANEFHPAQKGQSRSQWAEQRRNDLDDSKNIQISISRANVTFQGDNHATVKFQQSLKFNKMRKAKASRKTLLLTKSGGKWLIVEEKNK